MSFNKKVKIALCENECDCQYCNTAQIYGMLLFGKHFSINDITFQTENKDIVYNYICLLIELSSAVVAVYDDKVRKNQVLYTAVVENKLDREAILQKLNCFNNNNSIINYSNIKKDCCKKSFLKGVFMVCGSVINPQKEYHLEFAIHNLKLAQQVLDFLKSLNFNFKKSLRKNINIIYIKDSEEIEDFLTYLGAYNSSMEIMDIKILKDIRNKVNRVTNCETANIGKTINAASSQIEDINFIFNKKGESFLNDDLLLVAKLRLENPQASLKELCEKINNSISKSGINHRLTKISKISKEIKNNFKEVK